VGAAYGTAKAGNGIAGIGIWKPEAIMKCLIPVVMAGILGIYGMIVSVIIIQKVKKEDGYAAFNGYSHLSAGLACGLSSLAAGWGTRGCGPTRSRRRSSWG
jgi:V-type H+-transporting ATPase 16kDa proteolipid subunit